MTDAERYARSKKGLQFEQKLYSDKKWNISMFEKAEYEPYYTPESMRTLDKSTVRIKSMYDDIYQKTWNKSYNSDIEYEDSGSYEDWKKKLHLRKVEKLKKKKQLNAEEIERQRKADIKYAKQIERNSFSYRMERVLEKATKHVSHEEASKTLNQIKYIYMSNGYSITALNNDTWFKNVLPFCIEPDKIKRVNEKYKNILIDEML